MSARSMLRWLGRSMLSLLTALLLVGAGVYLHYLWAGPELQPWHRAGSTLEFTARRLHAGSSDHAGAIP